MSVPTQTLHRHHLPTPKIKVNSSSTTSSQPTSPTFTPSDSPSEAEKQPTDQKFDESADMDETKVEESGTKDDIQVTPPEGGSNQSKEDVSTRASESKKKVPCKKSGCKSRGRSKGRSKVKKEESSSESSSSSDSDSSSSDSESEESDSSEDEVVKRKSKKKALKKKKAKSSKKKKKIESDDDEDSEEDSSSEEEEKRKKRKKKVKKARKDTTDDETEDDAAAELAKLQVRRGLNRTGRGGRTVTIEERKPAKSKKASKSKKESKPAYFRVDQLWDTSIHNYKLTQTAAEPDEDEYGKYIFHVRRKFDWEGKYESTVIDIKSKPLKEALKVVMAGCKAVSFEEEIPAIDPNMLFMYLEETRTYMGDLKVKAKFDIKKKAKKANRTKAAHLKVLIKYIDKDYATTKKTLYPLLEANLITFDLLGFLYKSNEIAYCPTYSNQDEPRAFKIEYATKESSFMKGTWYSIEGRYLEYDGKVFGKGTMEVEVEAFKGPKPISSLTCYPLKYHKDADALREKLIERGRKFVALKGMNYRFHKGMAFYKKKRQVIKVNISGRIMIDPAGHRRINPNYPVSTVKPADPDILSEDEDSDEEGCGCGSDSEGQGAIQDPLADADKPRIKMKLVMDKHQRPHLVEVEVDANGNEIQQEDLEQKGEQEEFTEEDLLIASSVVLGFAFSEKLWLEFTVSGLSDIDWNDQAFESLQLPDNQKSIVKALVESHTHRASCNIDDVVQGKGRGLVAVLHGPPGTGKTLTAEGIAELLRCPLYMVSAGELGTNPRELEVELNKILDIAHSWGAILLLDEADVFLEKRTIQDIHRNALVSIFLRLLEYFQGILFLTTNRVETFDDAFQSRIHVALRYGELTSKAKRAVWKTFISKVRDIEGVEVAVFKEADFDKLAKHNLNGRQIKNAVRTAQALAVNEGVMLCMNHITKVLDVAEAFERDLKGGTGYEDAMRSYT